jgi:hypothetical protein
MLLIYCISPPWKLCSLIETNSSSKKPAKGFLPSFINITVDSDGDASSNDGGGRSGGSAAGYTITNQTVDS